MITVFTKNGCPQCNMTKKVLVDAGVEFQIRNVQEDEDALIYVKDTLGFSAMPVVTKEGFEPIVGFNPERLKELMSK